MPPFSLPAAAGGVLLGGCARISEGSRVESGVCNINRARMGVSSSKGLKLVSLHVNHPQLANPTIITLNQEELLKITMGVDQQDFSKWQTSLAKYLHPTHHLFLPRTLHFLKTGFCTNTGTAEVTYPKYPYLLSEEIYNRHGRKLVFTEEQFWFLLFYLLKAREEAKAVNDFLGDIRPKNVFLNEEGVIRVPCMSSWPTGNSKYVRSADKTVTFLAPEEMRVAALGSLNHEGREASESFSIGLTLLSMGNLADYEELYNLKSWSFDGSALEAALTQWKRKLVYSQILRSLVLNLCSEDASKRISSDQLWGMLSKNQALIQKKVPFVIDNAPNKLHEEVNDLRIAMENNPSQFVNSQLLSKVDGSGIAFPEHLQVQKVTPQYVFDSRALTSPRQH